MPLGHDDPQPLEAMGLNSLPSSTSPSLKLVLATPEEVEYCAVINSHSWSGPLSTEAYLRREKYLGAQSLAQDGGLSNWILIDSANDRVPRNILSACESWRKKAVVARQNGKVEDVVAHGIGSVYCRKEYRGKGYSARMLRELKKKLESWQQEGEKKASFNVLYSDIGKVFYARHGWLPYPSAHITLSAVKEVNIGFPSTKPLFSSDLRDLCYRDELLLRQTFANSSSKEAAVKVAFIPSQDTMAWHHAREEFVANEVLGKTPEVKGAMVSRQDGTRIWCIWTRSYAKEMAESKLFILRMVVDGTTAPGTSSSPSVSNGEIIDESLAQGVAACLNAAQYEAYKWGLHSVDIWNPSSSILAGARKIWPQAVIEHRDTESIPCLLWYDKNVAVDQVEWIANEKFGWC